VPIRNLNCQSFCAIFFFFVSFYTNPVNVRAFDEGEKEKENVCKMSIICSLSSSFSYMSLQMKEIPLVTIENKEEEKKRE
jgi:hypothetical protein